MPILFVTIRLLCECVVSSEPFRRKTGKQARDLDVISRSGAKHQRVFRVKVPSSTSRCGIYTKARGIFGGGATTRQRTHNTNEVIRRNPSPPSLAACEGVKGHFVVVVVVVASASASAPPPTIYTYACTAAMHPLLPPAGVFCNGDGKPTRSWVVVSVG